MFKYEDTASHKRKPNLAREVNLKSSGAATSRKYPRSNKNRLENSQHLSMLPYDQPL